MRRSLFILLLTLLLGLSPVPAQSVIAAPAGPHVVRVEFTTPEQLAALGTQLDIWEVHHESGTLVALVTPDERAALEAEGYRVRTDPTLSSHPDTIPGYPCYRTIDEQYAQINAWETQYSDIAKLSTIGYSYEGRPLRVMRLTRRSIGGEKPIFFLMANIHGRELITNEVVLVYIQHLLENYGTDPDITWLLNEHDMYVLVSANPDGHVKNEPGEPWAWWRKNTNPANGNCSGAGGKYGIDLNRNSSFKWGGASTNPCEDTYQGPSSASEVETQAMQSFVRSLFPDQRGPGDTDAAPDDTTGVLITLHSYSNLILWPWGHTYTDAPNAAQLRMLGEKMASYNGYLPEQASDLYPTTGSTDDWSYGELGIASYTFEIGSYGDGFYPPCSRYDALVYPNVDALLYAAKVARTPYMTPFGPDALEVTVTPDSALAGEPLWVQATINDTDNGDQTIVAAEAYVGAAPWDGGIAYPLAASDGAFDETVEGVQGEVQTGGLAEGRHMVYVRGKDTTGNWGPVSAYFVEISDDSMVTGTVTAADTGVPLGGADIAVGNLTYTYATTTESDGTYFIPLHAGTYTMTAAHFGYETQGDTFTVTTGVTATQDIALPRLPWGRLTVVVQELGTRAPLNAQVTIGGTPLAPTAHPSTTVELPVGNYLVTAATELGHEPRFELLDVAAGEHLTYVFRLPPPPPILFVDDDAGASYESYVQPHLDALPIPYDVWEGTRENTPAAEDLARYQSVLWFTGDDRTNSLNVSEQSALESYLGQGGRLLLSGQNIGADIKNDPGHFYRDMLRASFVQDDAGSDAGVVGSQLYAGITADLWGGSGAGNQDSPDVLAPYDAAATTVFTYTAGGTAGLAVERSGYRLLYLGFGLEGVGSEDAREEILRRAFGWLEITPPPAHLLLDVTMDPMPILRGGAATHSMELFNDSLMAVANGTMTVSLPMSVSVVSASPPATLMGHQVQWNGISLGSEEHASFSWTLHLPGEYDGDTVTQTVTASWARMTAPASWMGSMTVTETRVVLAPSHASLTGAPGEMLTHTLFLTNTGNITDTFDLASSGNAWTTLIPTSTGELIAGTSITIPVVVTIPDDAINGDSASVTITAISRDDTAVVASATLTTEARVANYPIYLPVVLNKK